MDLKQTSLEKLMKILIVSNSISGGGAERSMRILNKEFNLQKIDSTLLCLNNSGQDVPLVSEIILGRKWKSGLWGTIANFREFVQIYKSKSPEVLIVNCELPELYAAILPIRVKRIICVEHTSQPWAGRRKFGSIVRSLLFLRRVEWVTVNKDESRIWPHGSRAVHIANPVDAPRLSDSQDPQVPFVFVGRIREEKGIRMILEAVTKAGKGIRVFGNGNLEEELKNKYSEVARFDGFIENPWQSISAFQTIIVGSEYEGDGIVVAEAILAGMPILLRDNQDLRRFELSDDSYFKNKEELERKINQASTNPDVFRANRMTRDRLFAERSLEVVLLKWKTLIS
jgi:glycosyltransferase involved in cell wall biosynthesis